MADVLSFLLAFSTLFGIFIWKFFWSWWWILLPFLLFDPFKNLWLWWRADTWLTKRRWELFEVRIPAEIDNPFRRMEAVLAGMWQVHIGKNKREKWLEGKIQLGVSLEIASLEGKVHFYVRSEVDDIPLLKTSIYSQFPDAELIDVEDYSKQVPADIPNKEWDMWASSFRLKNSEDVYPIKTYKQFFEEQPTTREEEPVRVDPIGQLLEGMSKLGPGEQLWIQIMISPIVLGETGHTAKAQKVVNKIVRRPEKPEPKKVHEDIGGVLGHLITGKPPGEMAAEQESILPPEMRITPGERIIVTAIDEKVAKTSFSVEIRALYLAKRDVFFGGVKATAMSYFNQFSTEHLNGIVVDSSTWTKVHTILTWFFDARRLYLRKRRHFRYYKWRFGIHFPLPGGSFMLNTEELATIYHFPGKLTAPSAGLPRVEAKRGEAPPQLPVA